MAGVSLALFALYAAVTLGVRALVQWKLTGSTGIRGLRGSTRRVAWLAGALVVTGALASVASPTLVLAGAIRAPARADAREASALAIFTLGFVATFVAQMNMGRSWRVGVDAGERTELVTGGFFGVVRNPIYSAIFVALLGLALLVPTWVGVAAWALLVVALDLHVRLVEEPHLARSHGDGYLAYARRVGRFVPFVGTL